MSPFLSFLTIWRFNFLMNSNRRIALQIYRRGESGGGPYERLHTSQIGSSRICPGRRGRVSLWQSVVVGRATSQLTTTIILLLRCTAHVFFRAGVKQPENFYTTTIVVVIRKNNNNYYYYTTRRGWYTIAAMNSSADDHPACRTNDYRQVRGRITRCVNDSKSSAVQYNNINYAHYELRVTSSRHGTSCVCVCVHPSGRHTCSFCNILLLCTAVGFTKQIRLSL